MDKNFGAGLFQKGFNFADGAVVEHGTAAGNQKNAFGPKVSDDSDGASADTDGIAVKSEFFQSKPPLKVNRKVELILPFLHC